MRTRGEGWTCGSKTTEETHSLEEEEEEVDNLGDVEGETDSPSSGAMSSSLITEPVEEDVFGAEAGDVAMGPLSLLLPPRIDFTPRMMFLGVGIELVLTRALFFRLSEEIELDDEDKEDVSEALRCTMVSFEESGGERLSLGTDGFGTAKPLIFASPTLFVRGNNADGVVIVKDEEEEEQEDVSSGLL